MYCELLVLFENRIFLTKFNLKIYKKCYDKREQPLKEKGCSRIRFVTYLSYGVLHVRYYHLAAYLLEEDLLSRLWFASRLRHNFCHHPAIFMV